MSSISITNLPFTFNAAETLNGFDPIRTIELRSIREFLTIHASYFTGRVLDYGCGRQPYRSLVEGQGAEYVPWDINQSYLHDDGSFDAVLCTQVIQYSDDPFMFLLDVTETCKIGGHIVLTYPTNWDEVPGDCYLGSCDRWRFTQEGMKDMVKVQGNLEILHHELRAVVQLGSFRFPLGYGLIARRTA
jgi:SAM-dependent methyltransferase